MDDRTQVENPRGIMFSIHGMSDGNVQGSWMWLNGPN